MITRGQLLELGLSAQAIEHRLRKRRLHPLRHGVYAVGRPVVDQRGEFLALVLRCGDGAVLSHGSAGELRGLLTAAPALEVTVPPSRNPRLSDATVHRRRLAPKDATRRHRIPVTSPVKTLLDLALVLREGELEAAVNAADSLDLIDPERLRMELNLRRGSRGVAPLRATLDARTYTLTDSELERRFLPLAHRAGLGKPRTQVEVNGFRVDFYWPDLGLVVETDGLRYHRTPAQQARDRARDQVHVALGLTSLRFTHGQVFHEPGRVVETLAKVARRLRRESSPHLNG